MKLAAAMLLVIFIITALVYGAFAFIAWDIHWAAAQHLFSGVLRMLFVFVEAIITMLACVIMLTIDDLG